MTEHTHAAHMWKEAQV